MDSERRTDRDLSTTWGEDAADRYAAVKHGPDGAKFLDPFLYAVLREWLKRADVLDLGAGAGPWSKFAIDEGAKSVTALDLNPAMLEKARQAMINNEVLPENLKLVEGNVAQLPMGARVADLLMSINVGCNLPDGVFQESFVEALRVARSGARFVVTAPDSLLVPFTSSSEAGDIQTEINGLWSHESDHTSRGAKRVIDGLPKVLRATFVLDESGKPVLVTEENSNLVVPGTPIIRRIPGLAVDNNFHTAEGYIQAAEEAGWYVEKANRASFTSEAERLAYNDSVVTEKELGPEYVNTPSFLVMELLKK